MVKNAVKNTNKRAAINMATNIDILFGNNPGKIILVPFAIDETIIFLIQRIATNLNEHDSDFHYQDLYLNGVLLEYPQ
ncbi:hypothetical protein KI688_006644 [Linnemannia hyalina]|uniref:Uncharacterized protein n=1 Tax=Linnemannia hyalina TaxID=64524 RepID=A0A9P7XJT8_9FUNG|nr:hypothetical protein KI688_006644 [Linnemannia hyalina]